MTRLLKKILILTVMVITVASADTTSQIVGAWVLDSHSSQWTFRADGTGLMERGQPKTTARFNWEVRGKILNISTAGTLVPYELVQCDGRTMVIKNERVSQTYQLRKES